MCLMVLLCVSMVNVNALILAYATFLKSLTHPLLLIVIFIKTINIVDNVRFGFNKYLYKLLMKELRKKIIALAFNPSLIRHCSSVIALLWSN